MFEQHLQHSASLITPAKTSSRPITVHPNTIADVIIDPL